MSKKVRIRTKEILKDIDSGMGRLSLMRKYKLSEEGLESLFQRLENHGLLQASDKPRKESSERVRAATGRSGMDMRAGVLIEASLHGHFEAVRRLLDQGVDINARGNTGSTALMMACWWGHVDIVKLLLDRGANVNAKGLDGYTALMEAARYGRLEIAELLLERGAHVMARTAMGKTARSFAKEKGHTRLEELLLDYGAAE
jgi:ankyrin repeat protein